MIDKKTVAIIFLSLGLILATLFWVYPPFGAGMLFVGTYIADGFIWIVLNQPWGIVLGAGLVSMVWAVKRYDIIRSMKVTANRQRETAKTLGSYAPTGTVIRENPVVAPAQILVSAPALEEKKIV